MPGSMRLGSFELPTAMAATREDQLLSLTDQVAYPELYWTDYTSRTDNSSDQIASRQTALAQKGPAH